MFYLTTHSTHFYLRLYGVRHMVKDHSDSEKGYPLPPHRLLLSINSKGSFMHHPTYRITHTTAFVTPVVEHWLERKIAHWVHYSQRCIDYFMLELGDIILPTQIDILLFYPQID